MPRTYLFRSLVILAVLAGADLAVPAVDAVMMRWAVPYVCTFQLVRKSRARMEAVEAERRTELLRQGRLNPE